MPAYIEESKEIQVPPATGIPGFLQVVARILERPRVQEIVLSKDKITYRRFRRDDEAEAEVETDLATLMPMAVIRNSLLEELHLINEQNAAIAVSQLFARTHMDGMNPIAFASGLNSLFFPWHARTTSVVLARTECYGLPFLTDPGLPDEALFLCVGYSRRAALPDTVRSYKIAIPVLKERSKS